MTEGGDRWRAECQAAQAGGTQQYAPESNAAAEDAYRRANQAVMAGDYRLALNYALESREHALGASRQSADANVRARDDVQHLMADVAGLLAQTVELTEEAERFNVSHRIVREARQSLAQSSERRTSRRYDETNAGEPAAGGRGARGGAGGANSTRSSRAEVRFRLSIVSAPDSSQGRRTTPTSFLASRSASSRPVLGA